MRTLLTTTALVALLATGAVAQDAATTSTGQTNLLEQGYQLVDTDGLASKLLGFPVYSSAEDDAEQLGEINDIVIGEDGEVSAVIIGVGGFLGVGEKNVAVNYEELEWVVAADDTERIVLKVTREDLETAAAVALVEDEPTEQAAADSAAPAVQQPAEGEAADVAAAPADQQPAEQPAEDQAADVAAAPAEGDAAAEQPMEGDQMQTAEQQQPAAEPPAAGEPADDMQVAEQPAEQPVDENLETGAIQPDAAAPADGAAAIDRSTMTEFDESGLTAEQLIGINAYGPNNEHIGVIGDFVLGEDDTIDAVIIDFGGFLGMGVKEVAIAYEDLNFYSDEAGNVSLLLNITREQMDQAVAFNRDTYQQERDQQRLVVGSL